MNSVLVSLLKYGVSEGIARLAPFLTTLYVANKLSPEVFGKYSLLIVTFEIIFIVIALNIPATTRIDYFKEGISSFNEIKKNHLVISVALSMCVFLVICFVRQDELGIGVLLVFSALLRTVSVFIQAIFQCKKEVGFYILSNVSYVITLAISIFYFVENGLSFYSWLYALLVASLLQFLVTVFLYGAKGFSDLVSIKVTSSGLRKAFVPAIFFMPQAIGWWLKVGADRMIISRSLGDDILGQYSLAFQFASLVLIVVNVLNLVLVPELNSLLKERDHTKVNQLLSVSVAFVFIICIVAFFLGGFVISEYYGEKYPSSLPMFYFLVFAMGIQAVMLLVINVLYFEGDGLFVAKLIFFSFLLQAILNYNGVSYFGVKGLISCSVVTNLIVLGIVLLRKRKVLHQL